MHGRAGQLGRQGGRGSEALRALPEVAVEPTDTDGRALRLVTTPTDHQPVACRVVDVGDWALSLEILAASHRVRLVRAAGPAVTETVACHDGAGGPATSEGLLPPCHRWTDGGWQLRFRSRIERGGASVTRATQRLATINPDDPMALMRRFPGHSSAITALDVEIGSDGLTWRSWHLYPGPDPHVVTTITKARPQEHAP